MTAESLSVTLESETAGTSTFLSRLRTEVSGGMREGTGISVGGKETSGSTVESWDTPTVH